MQSNSTTHKRAFVSIFAIFGSRVFGLVREQVFAFFFGGSAILDAYIVAFRIPNLLRELLAEGALSQSFTSLFVKKLAQGDKQTALDLAHKVQTVIQMLVGALTILGILLAPHLVQWLAHGFSPEKMALTTSLTRILMPFIFFVAIAAQAMGILYAFNKYFVPHSASTIFNLVSVVMGLLLVWWRQPEYLGAVLHKDMTLLTDFELAGRAMASMAWGTLLGGVAQYYFQVPLLRRLGFAFKFDFRWRTPEVVQVLKLTGPAILGAAAVQINVMINTQFASTLSDGSVSWLSFAFRFMQFPLGLFGVAIATASAPTFATLIGQGKLDDMRRSLQSSIRLCLFLCVPATVGLLVLGQSVVGLIYQHGRFTASDTLMTTQALMAYALGITSYSLVKIYQPAFLAVGNSQGPMRISLLSIGINVLVNGVFILVLHYGHWSLALGTSLVATVNLLLLTLTFKRHLSKIWDAEHLMVLGKILLAAGLSGVLIFALSRNFTAVPQHTFLQYAMHFLTMSSCYVLAYVGLSWFLKIGEVRSILSKIKSRFSK